MRIPRPLTAAAAALLLCSPAAAAARWREEPAPVPSTTDSYQLTRVACGGASSCMSLGNQPDTAAPFADVRNGAVWSLSRPAVRPGSSGIALDGIACPSAGRCLAVGSRNIESIPGTLAERYAGGGWTVQPSADPGDFGNALLGAGCAGARLCLAVGYAGTDVPQARLTMVSGLVERLTGGRWVAVYRTAGGEDRDDELREVSCFSAQACTAVGTHNSTAQVGPSPLLVSFDGGRWRTIRPTGSGAYTGVACVGRHACLIVGTRQGRSLAARWDGRRVVALPLPGALGRSPSSLRGISCSTPTRCLAVGSFGASAGDLRIVWNGRRWAVQHTGMAHRPLSGVSCRSAFCVAVGSHRAGGHVRPLVERLS